MDTPVTHFNAGATKENKLEKARKNIALIKQIDKLEKEISTLEKKIQVKKSKIDELVAQL
jgi:wobble nucleotide-excising tRNase